MIDQLPGSKIREVANAGLDRSDVLPFWVRRERRADAGVHPRRRGTRSLNDGFLMTWGLAWCVCAHSSDYNSQVLRLAGNRRAPKQGTPLVGFTGVRKWSPNPNDRGVKETVAFLGSVFSTAGWLGFIQLETRNVQRHHQ